MRLKYFYAETYTHMSARSKASYTKPVSAFYTKFRTNSSAPELPQTRGDIRTSLPELHKQRHAAVEYLILLYAGINTVVMSSVSNSFANRVGFSPEYI